MAQVDFSNAHIEPLDYGTCFRSMYLALTNGTFGGNAGWNFGITGDNNSGTAHICSQPSGTITDLTEHGFKVIYDGTFSTSGDSFTLTYSWNSARYWLISNIHFEAGDTFHFQIDVNFSYQ